MILFLEDWQKPENAGAIVHTNTSNQSFIRLAHVLKKMGVKNYYFFLALHDKSLEFVDPYSPDLTQEQKIRITMECAINPWYYFREIAPVPSGNTKKRFKANRANISLFWAFFNNCDYFLIQPRQTGKSYSTDTLVVYVLNFSKEMRGLLYTKDVGLAITNIARLRDLFDRMPSFLCNISKKDARNKESISVINNKNVYKRIVAQESESDADKRGRGDTVEFRHCDEIAYCKNNMITIPTMGSAMNAARQDALAEGKFTASIFTTTAGKKDSPEGAWAYELYKSAAEWNELTFYDTKNNTDFEKTVRSHSVSPNPLVAGPYIIGATFSHRQLGYTDQQFLQMIIDRKVSPEAALRDYYNVWTSGNEVSPFTTKQLQMISTSKVEPEYKDIGLNGLVVNWYHSQEELEEIMKTKPIIVGMDSSNNIGRDSTTLTFVNAVNLDIIGTANCNSVNLYHYAQWLCDLMMRYRNILIVPENKSSAQGIIDYLIEVLPNNGIDPFKRIFNIIVNEREMNPRRFESMDNHPSRLTIANQHRPNFGYMTTGAGKYSRNNLYNETLYRAIEISADKIKDERLVKELLGLVITNGRIDHVKGNHDDQVISWLLACWFIFNARNVNYYDINKSRFLSDVQEAGVVVDREKQALVLEQEQIKNKIENLYEEMTNTDDYFDFIKLEKNIQALESRLNNEYKSKVTTISNMIEELKQNRRMSLIQSSPSLVNDLMAGLDQVKQNNQMIGRVNGRYFQQNSGDALFSEFFGNSAATAHIARAGGAIYIEGDLNNSGW